MASALFSGTIRISNTAVMANTPISALLTVSAYNVQTFVLAHGVSDYVVSMAAQSNPGLVAAMVLAGSVVRMNFAGHATHISHGSAGWPFKDLYAKIGSAVSGPVALHFANSSGDSATVLLITGM